MRRRVLESGQPGFSGCRSIVVSTLMVVTCALDLTAASGSRLSGRVSRAYVEARDLFMKVWEPGARSPSGGDGLGPLYNEQSCAGCHNLGGIGGAGRNVHNVTILSTFAGPPRSDHGQGVFQGELEQLHPGLRNHSSVVIHDHSTSPADEERLTRLRSYTTAQTREELVALGQSSRSTPALFGGGRIDAISDSTLLEAQGRKFAGFPEITGRVSQLKDGRLGRFGWKGQTSSLRDFVLAACANELGLEVPGHHQPGLAPAAEFDPSALKHDLDERECRLLVEFVRSLPSPVCQPVVVGLTSQGRAVFETIGCATCHTPRLGSVNGLYSDLLLHDMGDRFTDFGAGYGAPSRPARALDLARGNEKDPVQPSGDAAPTEWRTPPLWGVVSSAPYLHDGRAPTLDQAIRLHGGEAAKTTERYNKLGPIDRQALLAFLHSLSAPQKIKPPTSWDP